MKNSIVLLLLVAACVSSSSALRCYSCVFPSEAKCQENVKDLQGDDCSEPNVAEKLLSIKAVCLKSVVDVQGVKQITRSCSKQGGEYNACSPFQGHIDHCSVCDNDLCNSSTNLLISVWSVMMPVAVAFFMKFV